MAGEDRILTFTEFSVIFAWSFAVHETLCLLLVFHFLPYSGWVWFLVVEDVLVGILVAVETFIKGRVRSVLRTNKAYQSLRIAAFAVEAVSFYAIGVLATKYETASYAWYFWLLLLVKAVPVSLAAVVIKLK